MPPSNNPILREAAGRSARSLIAQLMPELEKISVTLDRAGEQDKRATVEEMRSTFALFIEP